MVNYIIDKKNINSILLTEFVKSVDKDFTPPLVGRVDIDLWVKKIYERGSIVIAEVDGIYVGCLLFYSNNIETKEGYIAYLAVDSSFRRQGLANTMLEKAIEISRASLMHSISVYTNNPAALKLYKSIGFQVESQEGLEECNIIQTYLIKKL